MDKGDRKYSNDDITVSWKPALCIHATTCYRELIEVFNPRKRPWVNMEGAPTEKIIEIVVKCPTNALTYDWNDPAKKSEKPGVKADEGVMDEERSGAETEPTEIRIMKNGPYVVEGDFTMFDSNGNELKKMAITSFCRCGQSDSMPFCDGAHRKIGFSDECE